MRHNRIFQIIVEVPTIWYCVFLLLLIYSIINGLIKYKTIIKCRKCFLEHEQYVKRNSSVFLKIINKVFWTFYILAIAVGAYMLYINNPDKELPLSSAYNDMPFVFIQDIEEPEANQIEEEKSNYIDRNSYVEINSTLLAPKQYSANQDSYIMYTHYYEVRFNGLVKPLTKELIKNDRYHISKNKYKKVQYEGLDSAYVSKDGKHIYVSASKGKKIMFIDYYGEETAEKILEEMAEVL